jgi:isoamyl acetate esterase
MQSETKPLVVLIGDSIRMAYQATVIRELGAVAEVWVPEANGGDSRNVLLHLDEWILARRPYLVHINCGLHDLKKDFARGHFQVPVDEYAENVRQILTRLAADSGVKIVWATTTPVDEKLHHENKGFDRFEADVVAYNTAAVAICRELGIDVDDLYAIVEKSGKADLLTEDGVHFVEEGSQVLGREVAAFIRSYL